MAVYLDNNATTPLKPQVKDAMVAALDIFGNPSSVHGDGRKARMAVDTARRQVASMFGVRAEQIVFTSGGSEANNMALRGYFAENPTKKLVISAVEHNCVYKTALELNRLHGVPLHILPVDKDGIIDLADLDDTLAKGNVGMVSVMHANNETGVLQPIADITKRVRDAGGLMHVDAVQSAGKMPLSFIDMDLDILTMAFHKMGGPKGVGVVILRPDIAMASHISGGSQEKSRRAGTENTIAIVGAGACAELWQKSVTDMAERIEPLRDYLEKGLKKLANDIFIIGETASRIANTTNVVVPILEGETAVMALDLEGYAVSTGSACSSGRVEPSRVILAHNLEPELALCALRISLGWQNTKDDVDGFLKAFATVLERAKKNS